MWRRNNRRYYRRNNNTKTKIRLFYHFRYRYGLGYVLHRFREETGKIRFKYEDFIEWYKQNWWRFHRKPLASQSIGRALRLFAEFNYVIKRVGREGRYVVFEFYKKS